MQIMITTIVDPFVRRYMNWTAARMIPAIIFAVLHLHVEQRFDRTKFRGEKAPGDP